MTEPDKRFSGLSDDLKPRELLDRAADPSWCYVVRPHSI